MKKLFNRIYLDFLSQRKQRVQNDDGRQKKKPELKLKKSIINNHVYSVIKTQLGHTVCCFQLKETLDVMSLMMQLRCVMMSE